MMPSPYPTPERSAGLVGALPRIARPPQSCTFAVPSAASGVELGAVKDASAVFDTRKRRLNARLGTSLKEFKTEVLDEVDATRRAREVAASS